MTQCPGNGDTDEGLRALLAPPRISRSPLRRLLAMRRELRQVLDDLGVGVNSPGGMPAVTERETDALSALDRAILHCATTLDARMRADGQEPHDWDYSRTIHDRAELTKPT